jgi:peptide/nickel transport system permease protein
MKKPRKLLGDYLITFLAIITLNFFIPRIMPGDPFTFVSSEEDSVATLYSEEEIARLRAYHGLDKPVLVQYRDYLFKLVQGDLGYSIYFHDPVLKLVLGRIGYTLPIVLVSLFLSCLLGCLLGCTSALRRNGLFDKIAYIVVTAFSQIPAFLVGIFLLFVLAGKLGWFPLSGAVTPFVEYGHWFEKLNDIVRHALLPVLALALSHLGQYYLLSRNSMLFVLTQDYMVTARAKGLSRTRILYIHALKNAILPIITRLFLSLGAILGGAVLIENVFNYPGLGTLMRQSITFRDYTLLQGIFLFFALLVLTMNLLADVIYRRLDPRVGA